MMKKLYKNALFDAAVAVIALAIGIVMLPVFEISKYCIDIIMALALVAYILLFISDKLKHTRGTVFGLTVLETVVLSIIVILLVIEQISPFDILSVCQAVGVVLWLRGAVITVTLYISALYIRKPKRNLPKLLMAIGFISMGGMLVFGSVFTDLLVEWVVSVALFVTALAFGALAFLFYHPKKSNKT